MASPKEFICQFSEERCKINGVIVQCLAEIKVVCTEATSMENDSVEAIFRFPVGIDLSKIREEFLIERSYASTETKESNEGSTSPTPPSESDDPFLPRNSRRFQS
jgi:hypothetical protein